MEGAAQQRWFSASLEAMMHMQVALSLLDDMPSFDEISAHLDLAVCRLRERIDPEGAAEVNALALLSMENIAPVIST